MIFSKVPSIITNNFEFWLKCKTKLLSVIVYTIVESEQGQKEAVFKNMKIQYCDHGRQ